MAEYLQQRLRSILLGLEGIACLVSARIKDGLRGYVTPKPIGDSDPGKSVDYDFRVVDQWVRYLSDYTGCEDPLAGRRALEIGPGSDLGTGIRLLSLGCAQYTACDVNELAVHTPDSFYDILFRRLETVKVKTDIGSLRREMVPGLEGRSGRLRYFVCEDFDIRSCLGDGSVDLVFSQAAFEHLDDVEETIRQLGMVCAPGAVLTAEVDMRVHSPRLSEKDPNNIYRYSRRLYDMFRFRGSPNRIRPFQYREFLERHGWTDVRVTPLLTMPDRQDVYFGMNAEFRDERNEMECLSIMLCARRPQRACAAGSAAHDAASPHGL